MQKQKTRVASNHACKINAPHTRTYPYEVSAMKRSSFSALSFIIYACRTILGGMITDITIASYIRVAYVLHFFHFRVVQEAEQKALISLLDKAWTTIDFS